MKIVTVVGARPQFIKAAVVSRVLRRKHEEILIHTGQHYDYNMSQCFFDELEIPDPDYNLGVSGGSHSQMTARIMIELEEKLVAINPDAVLLYGDTNSTLAAALVAAKMKIPICHVESGNRTHSITNPEEINRICTDRVSTLLLASTKSGLENLEKENLSENAYFVGDPMYDAFVQYSGKLKKDDVGLCTLDGKQVNVPDKYYYLTCHREENTGKTTLTEILRAVNSLDELVIYPVHPRNREKVREIQEQSKLDNIIFTEPVGYLESICLVNGAKKIVTDSGGVQREAFFAKKKCVTVLDFVSWPETMIGNRNELARPEEKDIIKKLANEQCIDSAYQPFGNGNSANEIVLKIEEKLI